MAIAAHPRPLDVFLSYSHKDEDLRDALKEHLAVLQRERLIAVWHDRKIPAGATWEDHIDDRLRSAHIVLLLVSPSFFQSDYCYVHELKAALARQQQEGIHVIPVLLRPVDWTHSDFAHLQALPTNARPVVEWKDRDAAFRDVVAALRRVVAGGGAEDSAHDAAQRTAANESQRGPRHSWVIPLAAALALTIATRAYFSWAIATGQLNAPETLVVFGFWFAACLGIPRLLRR